MLIREIDGGIDQSELINEIKNECSEFLSGISNYNALLYRGINTDVEWMRTSSPENRKPVDSSPKSQKIFDNLLTKLGATALRSNSLFCATDSIDAKTFGTLYYIIPVNGFSFTRVKNSPYDALIDINFTVIVNFGPKSVKRFSKFLKNMVSSYYSKDDYLIDLYKKFNNPKAAEAKKLDFGNDILEQLIYEKDIGPDQTSTLIDPDEFAKYYDVEFQDINKALNEVTADYEMMVHGEVYAISHQLIGEESNFRKKFAI